MKTLVLLSLMFTPALSLAEKTREESCYVFMDPVDPDKTIAIAAKDQEDALRIYSEVSTSKGLDARRSIARRISLYRSQKSKGVK